MQSSSIVEIVLPVEADKFCILHERNMEDGKTCRPTCFMYAY